MLNSDIHTEMGITKINTNIYLPLWLTDDVVSVVSIHGMALVDPLLAPSSTRCQHK